jgi:hypothetical protein
MTSAPVKPPYRPHLNDNFAKDATRPNAESEDRWVANFIANLTGALEVISRRSRD